MIKKYVTEFELYDLVDSIGHGDYHINNGKVGIHILDTSEQIPINVGDGSYRVYISTGLCFDIKKELEETGECENTEANYSFYNEWDGYRKISLRMAYDFIKRIKK